jgi:antibiotic biosynthesis monooxygenase (ABM) superfamily enzyme
MPDEPVTVTVARRVVPGHEQEFEDWADEALHAASRFPGYLGGGVLRPNRAGADWHMVYRFSGPDTVRAWEASPERAAMLRRADQLIERQREQRTSGLETWFEMPGRTAPAPPRWKMAVVSVMAVIPISLLLNWLLTPRIAGWPLLARTLAFAGVFTTLMTWVAMPRLSRWLSWFLYPRTGQRSASKA